MEEGSKEFLDTFLDEAEENLQVLSDDVLEYEDTRDDETLDDLFRAAHTIKGSAAGMGLDDISELAHSIEDVFDGLKKDELDISDSLIDLLLNSIEALEDMVEEVEETESDPEKDVSELLEKLEKAKKGEDISDVKRKDLADSPESAKKVEEIKVDVDRLDDLMNSVGELMITEKKLRGLLTPMEDDELETTMNQLKRLGEDIQHEISRARMIPVSQVFDRFPRLVRDTAKTVGKEVDFQIEGSDLRLDRTILDYIGEPIIHMLRNAIDHGIEKPEKRREKGKPETGNLILEARRERNLAIISVKDDGRGIDVEDIKETALERNVVTREELEEMSDNDILELIFDSSFSTKDEVTEVSGRGVGLNVVKETANQLHGSYSIDSTVEEGTEITMELPLSLAVVRCFLIRIGIHRLAIPLNSIERCVYVYEDDIEYLEGQDVFIYDNTEIPLINLAEELDYESDFEIDDDKQTVVVVKNAGDKAGLIVDEIDEVQDFVIKDIGVGKPKGIAGASILSDGKPAVILDVASLLGE